MKKEKILKSIEETKIWLEKAEKWAKENNLVRALMLLFLASAEIQRPLKESMQIESKPYLVRKTNFRIVPAVAIAASILIISLTASFLYFLPEVKQAVKAPLIITKKKSVVKSSPGGTFVKTTVNKEKEIESHHPVKKIAYIARKKQLLTHFKEKMKKQKREKIYAAQIPNTSEKNKDKVEVTSDTELLDLVRVAEKTLKEGIE